MHLRLVLLPSNHPEYITAARVNDFRDAITDRDEQIRKLEAERDSYKIAYRASLKTLQGFSSDEEAEEQGEGDTPDAGGIVQGLEGARDPIRPDIPHVPARVYPPFLYLTIRALTLSSG